MDEHGSILVTGAAGQLGAVGRTVTGLLLDRGLPVRAMVHREDDRAAALRTAGAEVVVGDLLEPADVYRVVSGCRRVYFGMSVSARYLEATVTMAAVAREVGVNALVNMSQMTVSQMSIQNTTPSLQQRQHKRAIIRPPLRRTDRLFWIGLARIWTGGRQALVIVTPATVLQWQRRRFREYWTRLSRHASGGRPQVHPEIKNLIIRMATANPLWGAPRIHGELLKLGINVAERTVSQLRPKRRPRPSQTWRTFLANHVRDLVSLDFFTVPTARQRVLFVLVVLAHHRRRVLHFNVTEHPTAHWTAQQIVDAFPDDSAPLYLLRDRDSVYGHVFQQRVKGMGIAELLTAPQSPWQNPFAERLIGSVRRECLNHVLVLSERHLRRILTRYFAYYHRARTHLSLDKDAPDLRPVQLPAAGPIVEIPEVCGLHHRYVRVAA